MQHGARVRRAVRARLAANIVFDHGKAVDDVAERAMHRFQRVLGARDIVFEVADPRRILRAQFAGARVLPHVFEVNQKIGQSAFDPFQMAEPRIGSVQLFRQPDDAILEMAESVAAAARKLNLLDFAGEQFHQGFQPGRYRCAALRALGQRIRERGNTMIEMAEHIAAGSGAGARHGHGVDFFAERVHLGGEPAHGVVGGDMVRSSRAA